MQCDFLALVSLCAGGAGEEQGLTAWGQRHVLRLLLWGGGQEEECCNTCDEVR